MKSVDNLKRLFQINNCSEYSNSKIFKNFIELKELEQELENYLNSTDEIPLEKIKYLKKTNEFLCRESYYSYFKQSFPAQNPLVLGEHIELICDVLTLAERGLFKDTDTKSRIAISIPPRHLKSTSITNCYPSWFMGRAPWRSTIVASYGDNLAEKAGQKNRERIQNFAGDLFGIEIKGDVAKKALWELTGGGRFKGTTMRGGATGEGCELMIIDDPVKNREEANSKTIQTRIWDEYQDTFMTRPHQNCVIILIMTRWSNNDLRGMIEENEKGLKWLKLDLMAICETEEEVQEDPLGRDIGVALYPQMFDIDYFQPFKANPRTWWSLYKQRPQIDTGEHFKREYFQYFDIDQHFVTLYSERGMDKYLLKNCWAFQSIDTAQKTGQENDETGIITWIITPDNDMLIVDVYYGRIEVPDQEKVIDQYWNKYELAFQAIEDKQSGTGIIQTKLREGRPIVQLKATTDKIERATTAVLYYANMKVYHRKGAEWLGYLENQLLEFPNGKHDDLVDCVSYGAKVVAEKSKVRSIL